MNLLQATTGGRPFVNDDLIELQAELYDAIDSPLQGAGAMVLSGCVVSRAAGAATGDISAGYIWIAGQICRYRGANGVPFPAEVVAGPQVDTDLRQYQTGTSNACFSELSLLTQADGTAPAGTERVLFQRRATRTYAKWLESLTRQVGDLADSVAPYLPLIDTTPGATYGLGLADGPRAGWALANGNNGTADLQALFRVALSNTAGPYDAPGKTGGLAEVQLTADQNGPHTHGTNGHHFNGDVTYDSGSSGARAANYNNKSTATIDTSGQGLPHENRPPFYTVVVWQWVGLS